MPDRPPTASLTAAAGHLTARAVAVAALAAVGVTAACSAGPRAVPAPEAVTSAPAADPAQVPGGSPPAAAAGTGATPEVTAPTGDAAGPDLPDDAGAPPPAGDPSAASPNATVPPPATPAPPAPSWTFDQNTLSTSGDDAQQYPGCLTCGSQYYYRVDGCPAAGVGTKRPCQSFCHVKYGSPITYYLDDPPASGNHYPSPERRLGEHASPVARGYYVHSMEHGAVVLLHNCPDGCDAELALLRQVVAQRSRPGDAIIMTPDPLMHTSRFAAVSWTWIYTFDQPDVAALLCFVDQHQNHGRENKPL